MYVNISIRAVLVSVKTDAFSNLDQNSLSITNANTDKATGLLDRILLQPTVVQNNKYEKYFLLFLVVP